MKKIKLIIDISEEEYENVLKFTDCYAFGYAIANGRPLQEEFEKIKAEIKQQGSIHVKYRRTEDVDHLVDSIVYQCKDGFCNRIDNHIKELKGENNDK